MAPSFQRNATRVSSSAGTFADPQTIIHLRNRSAGADGSATPSAETHTSMLYDEVEDLGQAQLPLTTLAGESAGRHGKSGVEFVE